MEKSVAFAPYPPATIRLNIAPGEWKACLDAWLAFATHVLRLPEAKFQSVTSEEKFGVITFITTYVQEISQSHQIPGQSSQNTTSSLHKSVFLLCHRILSLPRVPSELISWKFLANFSRCYHSVSSLPKILSLLWNNHSASIEPQLQTLKKDFITKLDSGDISSCLPTLQHLNPLLRASPLIGSSLALGTDLVDSLANSYPLSTLEARKVLTVFTYLLLISLVSIPKPDFSVLSEHLYTLKDNAKLLQSQDKSSLLMSIVSETAFIHQLEKMSSSGSDSGTSKGKGAVPPVYVSAGLQEFIDPKKTRSKRNKGKSNAAAVGAIEEDVHIHRMTQVIKIQEIFPDYGSGFITNVLREYNDDDEVALNHLLSETLPPHLADSDRSEQLMDTDGTTVEDMEQRDIMEPRSTPPPSRRSKFDGDELDKLTVDASRLHLGKAHQERTADDLLSSGNVNKNAIYASLASFDADDDERDDTYDAGDVGGTVDITVDTDRDQNDDAVRILYQTYKSYPNAFARDAPTRSSIQRSKLKQDTKWTDEQIEGWGSMLVREPRRFQALERRFAEDWQGQQHTVQRTAWNAAEEDEEADSDGQPRNSQRGAHRGGFRGGRGRGNAAGPSGEASTQRARRAKDARGTHNRREGRAKKVARGMGGPAP
jgi:activating signal cointegrator complex subunit 2